MDKTRQTAATQRFPVLPTLPHGPWGTAKQLPEWMADLWTERLVLGLVLVDPTLAAERLVEIQSVMAADDFFALKHSLLFKRLDAMRRGGLPLDLVSLVQELDRAGELEAVGGSAYVASLVDGVPRIADVRFTCRNMRRKALLRLAAREAENISAAALQRDAEPGQLALRLRELADHLLETER